VIAWCQQEEWKQVQKQKQKATCSFMIRIASCNHTTFSAPPPSMNHCDRPQWDGHCGRVIPHLTLMPSVALTSLLFCSLLYVPLRLRASPLFISKHFSYLLLPFHFAPQRAYTINSIAPQTALALSLFLPFGRQPRYHSLQWCVSISVV